jgi:tetratricopeptide (TPR) repeat protein
MDTQFRKKVRHSAKQLKNLIKINEIKSELLEIKLRTTLRIIEKNQEQIDECEDKNAIKYLHSVDVFFRETKDEYEKTSEYYEWMRNALKNILDNLNEVAYYDEDERKVSDKIEDLESPIIIAQEFYDEGNAFEVQKNYNEALNKYSEAIKLNPTNAHYWSRKGFCENEIGNPDDALKSHTESIKYDSENATYWHYKGWNEYELGDIIKSLESYTQAVKYEKKNAFFWQVKSGLENKLGEYSKALESISESLKLDPNDHYNWWGKSQIEIKLQKYENAIESYNKALDTAQKELEEKSHPNYRMMLKQNILDIQNEKKHLQNELNSSTINSQNMSRPYENEYDITWFTRQMESQKSTFEKNKEDSLEKELEYEFNEELEEDYDEDYDEET